jgi:hypothetical protein
MGKVAIGHFALFYFEIKHYIHWQSYFQGQYQAK